MKFIIISVLMFLCLPALSCAPVFKKGGYFLKKDNDLSYYANDRKKIYILLSDQYFYDKKYFNSQELLPKDIQLLQDFNLKSKKILFSYHSPSGRESAALFQNSGEINFKKFNRSKTENMVLFYRTEIRGKMTFRENIFAYKNRWIHIVEKSPSVLSGKSDSTNINKLRIFPSISNEKPKQ